MNLIQVKNIDFSYSKNPESTFFLNDISLSIKAGEFITILGPNGSGKSTLLKLLGGSLYPNNGDILLKEKSYSDFAPKELAKNIAFVPQFNYSVFPFSVNEIVMMGRTPYLNLLGYENKEDIEIVDEALEIVGISDLKNKGIHEISGGESQRAFIARALAQKPKIILLDEPSAHLDIKHQISIFNILKERNEQEGLTIVSVSHDLNLTGHYSHRTLLMQEGTVLFDDRTSNILTEENIKKVFDVKASVVYDSKSNATRVYIEPEVNIS